MCKELGIYCWSSDIHQGYDACAPAQFPEAFAFCWLHPPYWRRSCTPTTRGICHVARHSTPSLTLPAADRAVPRAVVPGGKLAILMGDYSDREDGYIPLVFWTKYWHSRPG